MEDTLNALSVAARYWPLLWTMGGNWEGSVPRQMPLAVEPCLVGRRSPMAACWVVVAARCAVPRGLEGGQLH
jgi:hypothetical protein